MSRRNLSLLIAALIVSLVCYERGGQNPHVRFVAEGFEQIDQHAYDRPADEELVAGAIEGMARVFQQRGDENTSYQRPREAQHMHETLSGEFGGIGVVIRVAGEPPRITVARLVPGMPAVRAGVRRDDQIVAINGEQTEGLSIDDARDLMRGQVGEPLTLSVLHAEANDPVDITLTRKLIQVPSVLGDRPLADGSWRHLLEQDPRIALVRIESFGDRTVEELRELLPRLEAAGMRALVLDLRDNPGGTLDAGIYASELFLPRGASIVDTRDRFNNVLDRWTSRGGICCTTPLTVLINRNSASASELMAGCLQDNKRAVLIGERSFGKGTVQRLIALEGGQSRLRLTSATFWRPSGQNIHRWPETPVDAQWGIRPNKGFEIKLSDDQYLAYRKARNERDIDATPTASTPPVDRVLERAIEALQEELRGKDSTAD